MTLVLCITMPAHYTISTLYSLKQGCGYPPPDVIVRLKSFGLFKNRGKKRGSHVHRSIPVISSNKCESKVKSAQCKPYKHFEVSRVWYDLPCLFMSNVTSLCNKFDELVTTVKTVRADIVAITEAWQVTPETCTMENYDMFHHLRTDRRGGGVVIFCRRDLTPSRLHVDVPEGVEVAWVRVSPTPAILPILYTVLFTIHHDHQPDLYSLNISSIPATP